MKQTSWKILAVLPADLGQRGKAERNSQTTSHPPPPVLTSFVDVPEDSVVGAGRGEVFH